MSCCVNGGIALCVLKQSTYAIYEFMCIVPQKVFKEEGIMLQLRRIIAYFQNRNICQDSQNIYFATGMYMCTRCLLVSTNQADPVCFYFRIS